MHMVQEEVAGTVSDEGVEPVGEGVDEQLGGEEQCEGEVELRAGPSLCQSRHDSRRRPLKILNTSETTGGEAPESLTPQPPRSFPPLCKSFKESVETETDR